MQNFNKKDYKKNMFIITDGLPDLNIQFIEPCSLISSRTTLCSYPEDFVNLQQNPYFQPWSIT